jgi:uncharacterized protein YwgA
MTAQKSDTTKIKPAWIALVEILKRIEDQPYHHTTGRTIFQKIAYVATEEGLPTELSYQRSSYGPFSRQLKGVQSRLLNNGLIKENKKGRMFEIVVGRTFLDARKAYEQELASWESIIEKVVDLFLRLNTDQAEIVATVIYSAKQLKNREQKQPTEQDVLSFIMDWKAKRLNEGEVALTIRNLAALDWLDVKASSDLPLPKEAFLDF